MRPWCYSFMSWQVTLQGPQVTQRQPPSPLSDDFWPFFASLSRTATHGGFVANPLHLMHLYSLRIFTVSPFVGIYTAGVYPLISHRGGGHILASNSIANTT